MQPIRRKKDDAVRLLTLHASKGLEFDCVFIAGLEEKTLPIEGTITVPLVTHTAPGGASGRESGRGSASGSGSGSGSGGGTATVRMIESVDLQLDEERRLLYVGVTRARKRVFLCYRDRYLTEDGRAIPVSPSRFLRDLPPDTVKTRYRPPYSSTSKIASGYASGSGSGRGKVGMGKASATGSEKKGRR